MKDLSSAFPELVKAGRDLPLETLLDGEIVIADADGCSNFGSLQERLGKGRRDSAREAQRSPAVLLAFDLVRDAGVNLVDQPPGAVKFGAAHRPIRRGDRLVGRASRAPARRLNPSASGSAHWRAANQRLYLQLARLPTSAERNRLKELLVVPAGTRRSALDRLRRGPTQPTAVGLLEALRRLRDVRQLGIGDLDLGGFPAGRLRQLARYANAARAQAIQRMPAARGVATLVAFASSLETSAQDDALDVLDRLLTGLFTRVERQEQRRRLRTIGDLDAAALLLREVGLFVLHRTRSDQLVRPDIFERVPPERIEQTIATIGAVLSRYSMVRQFLPLLLETITPRATEGGRAALAAWDFLRRIESAHTSPATCHSCHAPLGASHRAAAPRPGKPAPRSSASACRETDPKRTQKPSM